MRFGCCGGLGQIRAIQDAGYDYIEMPVDTVEPESPSSEFDEIREEIRSHEIVPEVWNYLIPDDIKIVGDEVDSYRVERYLRTAFERVEELGGEIVVFGCGESRKVPDGFDRAEARDQIIEFLTLAGQIAGTYGITIAVEPLSSNVTNIINTISEAMDYVKTVDHPFVKTMVDLYQMKLENEPIQNILEADNDLVHVHTADPGRLYMESGTQPYADFFEMLRSIGYNDRMSMFVECSWKEFDEECEKALEFLKKLSAEFPI